MSTAPIDGRRRSWVPLTSGFALRSRRSLFPSSVALPGCDDIAPRGQLATVRRSRMAQTLREIRARGYRSYQARGFTT